MQSLFTNLTSLMVMFHMAIGCQWHHGLGDAGGCQSLCEVAACDHHPAPNNVARHHDCRHEHGHSAGGHDQDNLPTDDSTIDGDLDGSPVSHTCCCNDRCSVTKVVQFELATLDCFHEYLGGAENASLASVTRSPNSVCYTTPDFSHTRLKLRAHLTMCVLVI